MPASLLVTVALFTAVICGLGWPIVARRSLVPMEKITATAMLSMGIIFLGGWATYVLKLPVVAHWALPLAATAGLIIRWREFRLLWDDPAVRETVPAQIIVSTACLGWLALVVNYSGGGWTGDWFEHWERARFYLDRSPVDSVFIGHATVTARPPLANVVSAVFLSVTRSDFAHYQILSTLAASLVFLPASLLARRFGGVTAIPILTLLCLLSPLFLQNATFAWTKLPTAFFVLGAVHFFLRLTDGGPNVTRAMLLGAGLAAGLLTHYSAGPYAVVLVIGWLVLGWSRRSDPRWWRDTAVAASVGTAILATWFGWAFANYGVDQTLLANTSVQAADPHVRGQLARIALNIRDTLVPYCVRTMDTSLIAQRSPWAGPRDAWFQLYQVNLLFAFGSVAWTGIVLVLVRAWRGAKGKVRAGWAVSVGGAIVLGIAVHGARDTWGLTHICLQPVVLLGLAFLSARWTTLPRGWKLALFLGAALDFLLGIALHFAVQNLAFERWGGPEAWARWQADNSTAAVMNYAAKLHHHLVFFGDSLGAPPTLVAIALALLIGTTIARAARAVRIASTERVDREVDGAPSRAKTT